MNVGVIVVLGLGFEVPPTFRVDLNQPPETRWNGAVKRVLDRHPFDESFYRVFAAHNASGFFKALTHDEYDRIGRWRSLRDENLDVLSTQLTIC